MPRVEERKPVKPEPPVPDKPGWTASLRTILRIILITPMVALTAAFLVLALTPGALVGVALLLAGLAPFLLAGLFILVTFGVDHPEDWTAGPRS
jgi:hypothetical protein